MITNDLLKNIQKTQLIKNQTTTASKKLLKRNLCLFQAKLKIIITTIMKKSSPYNLRALMNNRIQCKYKNILSFYEAKSINQIMAMNPHCTAYMDFCDLRIISEDIQYLKRVYYHRTLTGKPQIEPRMKIICQHYATNPALSTFTYEYPMMILTNTKSLFTRRKRRLRKIQAGQGSSDFTEQREQQFLQFETKSEVFLLDLQNSAFSEQDQQQQQELSFQSNPHDIYSQGQFQDFQQQKITFRLTQENIKHLIYDQKIVKDPQSIYNHLDIGIPLPPSSKHTLTNTQNQNRLSKQRVMSVVLIEQSPKIERKEKTSLLGNMINQILQRPINFSRIGLKLDRKSVNQINNLEFNSQHQSLQKQKEERASKRQKIRQKAEELLRKVRNTAVTES